MSQTNLNPMAMNYEIFDEEDNSYLQWMIQHPTGYILNAWRAQKNPELVLHRSGCHHIATTASLKRGAYTEREAIKIASTELNVLEYWANEHRLGFSGTFKECKTCNPMGESKDREPIVLFPEIIDDPEEYNEGAKKQVWVNFYERDSKARQRCLKEYGHTCKVCEFDLRV